MSASGIRAGKAFVEVGANSAPLDAALARLRGKLTRFGRGLAAVGAGLLGAGIAGAAALAWPLKLAADLEKTHAGFLTMLGDAEAVTKLMKELQEFAASTPFELPELQEAARMMLAFGSGADSVVDELRMLGDVAAGVGMPLGELAEIYGKNRVQGRLFGEDINQLTGRGIPVIQELAKQFGVSESEIKSMVSEGKVGFAELQTAMQSLATTGIFAGGMERQSQTLLGLWSTLKDTIAQAILPIGQALLPVVADVVRYTTAAVAAVGALIKPWASVEVAIAGVSVAGQIMLQSWYSVVDTIRDYWADASNGIAAAGAQAAGFLRQAWVKVISYLAGLLDWFWTKLKQATTWSAGLLSGNTEGAKTMNQRSQEEFDNRQTRRRAESGLRAAEIGYDTAQFLQQLEQMAQEERAARRAGRQDDLTEAQKRLADARQRLKDLQTEQVPVGVGPGGTAIASAIDEARKRSSNVSGTFNASLTAQQAGLKPATERTAKATERTAKAVEKIARDFQGGGLVVGG
jgi:tape measure domain-containing protein